MNVIVHEDVHLKRTEPNFLNWTFQELCTHGSCFIMRTLAGVKDRAETSNYTPRYLSVVITFPAFIPASGTQFLKFCGGVVLVEFTHTPWVYISGSGVIDG